MRMTITILLLLLVAGLVSCHTAVGAPDAVQSGNGAGNSSAEAVAGVRTLPPLPTTPNAVSSLTDVPSRLVDPLPMAGDVPQTMALILRSLEAMGGNSIAEQDDRYVHSVFVSSLFRFKDDVELLIDEGAGLVHYRSASRVGYWDFGVNRRRYEAFRKLYMGLKEKGGQ
ncbi:DUF1499 domain-containing protein [Desulfovibrio mangrovi]|uniref:DUF1499 domain-containing protein n=1 Tax=Desulfovibrio mangrovi TaxID=2976983 RepID=UPI002245AD6B|nr:DUF1499 domain-containing protein [Desulfovibrio mangrovi]UZP68669.1 DUF1499 domain-containing protein [Desulfovibrio mangrovi]